MKRKIILAAAFVLIAALGGCGRTEENDPIEADSLQTELQVTGGDEQETEETMTEESEQGSVENEETENDMVENQSAQNSHILIAYYSQPTDVDTSDLDAVSSASVVVRDGEVAGSTTEYVAKII